MFVVGVPAARAASTATPGLVPVRIGMSSSRPVGQLVVLFAVARGAMGLGAELRLAVLRSTP